VNTQPYQAIPLLPPWVTAHPQTSRPCTCKALPDQPRLWAGVALTGWITSLGTTLFLLDVPIATIGTLFGVLFGISLATFWTLSSGVKPSFGRMPFGTPLSGVPAWLSGPTFAGPASFQPGWSA